MSFLGNLFGKVEQTVAELAPDGSVVSIVHEPKSNNTNSSGDGVSGGGLGGFLGRLLGILEMPENSHAGRMQDFMLGDIGGEATASTEYGEAKWEPKPDGWDGDVPIYLGQGWG